MALLLESVELFSAEKRQAKSIDSRRRGRVERRTITTAFVPGQQGTEDLSPYTGFAKVRQVFRLERRTHFKKSGTVREQSIFGITSLSPEQATHDDLLSLVRGHWRIENRSHYVRDVTFGEDKSQVRSGNLPQVMALFRNTAISLARLAGWDNLAAACRRFAARPEEAIQLLGLPRTE